MTDDRRRTQDTLINKDIILRSFLERQYEEAMALAKQSDLIELLPYEGEPPYSYIVRFLCKSWIRAADGQIVPHDSFEFGIRFPADYLRTIEPMTVVTCLAPNNVFHPQISFPFICLGRLVPGLGLVDLLHQIYDVLSYHNWASHDGLNLAACQWARNNAHLFPSDRRPLKRRNLAITVETRTEGVNA